jgi:hypothetical protein
MAEPMRASNSFVGTEEYIAPVCISSHIICMIPILMFGRIYQLIYKKKCSNIQIYVKFVKIIILILFELVRKCINFLEFFVNLCRKL